MAEDTFFKNLLDEFQQFTKNPEKLLNFDNGLIKTIKTNLKNTYDYCKREEKKPINVLPELIIKNFDCEQIWQQIDLQNIKLLENSIAHVSNLVVGKESLVFEDLKKKLVNDEDISNAEENLKQPQNSVEVSKNVKVINKNESDESDGDSDEESFIEDENLENSDEDNLDEINIQDNTRNGKKSIVDDDFFKLDEMEQFLNAEDKKAYTTDQKPVTQQETDSESEEEEADLFESGEEDEEDNDKMARFKDFFVSKGETKKKEKRSKFLDDFDSEYIENDPESKTSFEVRQERLKKKIDVLEEKAIRDKPWQLKGEIKATDRPQNSLLENILDFDVASRPAPVITEQTTLQLEDIIKQRIKDKVFDSVERKVRSIETPLEYKKKLVLDQEKSKESLAKVYEKEYLEQQAALDPEHANKEEVEPDLHKEIKTMMKNLFYKLDSLSNFHFSPKPVMPEMRIVNNMPAINIEEVAPVATSDAALLAPEEVRNKAKGEILGKEERTKTDKNRERRKKKQKVRAHLKEKENKGKNKPVLNQRNSKMKKTIEKGNKNIKKMDESNVTSVKSSKTFFTKLQEEVQTQIYSKQQAKKRKKNTSNLEAKKMKL